MHGILHLIIKSVFYIVMFYSTVYEQYIDANIAKLFWKDGQLLWYLTEPGNLILDQTTYLLSLASLMKESEKWPFPV